jgi:integrase
VFPNGQGRALRRMHLRKDFSRHLERAGLPQIRFHVLRHTAATLMLGVGVPIPTASHTLGHKNPTQTLNRYAHVLSDMHNTAAERIDRLPF